MEKKFYQPNPEYNPTVYSASLETFKKAFQAEYDKWKPPRFIEDNLTKDERRTLKNIKKNNNIIYKWEDKGSSFTKMNRNDYVKVGEESLQNGKFYKKCSEVDPSMKIAKKVEKQVLKMKEK